MNNKIIFAAAFVAGVGVGAAVSRFWFKNKYEAIADEEIESIKEAYSKFKVETKKTTDELAAKVEDMNEVRNIIDSASYSGYVVGSGDYPRDDIPDYPYEITEEEYSESELSYDKITLQYFVDDDILFDPTEVDSETGGIVIGQTIGDDGINRVRTSDDTYALYFRNDNYGADYEVVKVSGSFYKDK